VQLEKPFSSNIITK